MLYVVAPKIGCFLGPRLYSFNKKNWRKKLERLSVSSSIYILYVLCVLLHNLYYDDTEKSLPIEEGFKGKAQYS